MQLTPNVRRSDNTEAPSGDASDPGGVAVSVQGRRGVRGVAVSVHRGVAVSGASRCQFIFRSRPKYELTPGGPSDAIGPRQPRKYHSSQSLPYAIVLVYGLCPLIEMGL